MLAVKLSTAVFPSEKDATPDALTMLVVMAPMVVLYFAGIGVSALVVGKRNRRLAAAAGTPAAEAH